MNEKTKFINLQLTFTVYSRIISKVENEKIISQFVGTSKVCDPNGKNK